MISTLGSNENTTLLPPQRKARSSQLCRMSIENQIIAYRVSCVVLMLTIPTLITAIAIACIVEYPIKNFVSILSIISLGAIGIGILYTAKVVLGGWKQHKEELIAAYPHYLYLRESYRSILSKGLRFDLPGSNRYTGPIVERFLHFAGRNWTSSPLRVGRGLS